MISLWNRVVSPALAAPLRIGVRWDADPPPALAWMLRNDRLVVALAAATTAVIWYVLEPIVVTHDSFAYLDAAKLSPASKAEASPISGRRFSLCCWP
jgi:hypothetical protein